MNQKYYVTPQKYTFASQAQAKQAFDQLKKTNLWPEPYLAFYRLKKSDTPVTAFCWVIKDGERAQVVLPAYPLDKEIQFHYKSCRLQHLPLGSFFLIDDVLYTLQYDVTGGYVVKEVSWIYSVELANIYATLKYGTDMFWSLEYLVCGDKKLGVFWIGTADEDADFPDAIIAVWLEDKKNFAGCSFNDISAIDINIGYAFEHDDDLYLLKKSGEQIYICAADEPESLTS